MNLRWSARSNGVSGISNTARRGTEGVQTICRAFASMVIGAGARERLGRALCTEPEPDGPALGDCVVAMESQRSGRTASRGEMGERDRERVTERTDTHTGRVRGGGPDKREAAVDRRGTARRRRRRCHETERGCVCVRERGTSRHREARWHTFTDKVECGHQDAETTKRARDRQTDRTASETHGNSKTGERQCEM